MKMLTIHAAGHEVMQHFHRPSDEKRSVVVLNDEDYLPWLHADTAQAKSMLSLAPVGVLTSQADPRS